MENNTELISVLRPFLHSREKVLVCGMPGSKGALSAQAARAAAALEGDVISWDLGQSWQALLRKIFSQRVTVLMGEPKVILGIAKTARATGTPLTVRHAVLLGSPRESWLLKGIRDTLDAQIHICRLPDSEEGDFLVQQLDEMLLSWASVLDYRVQRTEAGLRLEIVIFPGHPLPKLPSGADVTVRPWNPGQDAPYASFEG